MCGATIGSAQAAPTPAPRNTSIGGAFHQAKPAPAATSRTIGGAFTAPRTNQPTTVGGTCQRTPSACRTTTTTTVVRSGYVRSPSGVIVVQHRTFIPGYYGCWNCLSGPEAYGPVGFGSFYPPAMVEFFFLLLILAIIVGGGVWVARRA